MSPAEKTSSPKYAQLLDTAQDLFMRFGVKRVTVEEICQTAAVSKMTFYKYFKNKNDLVMRIMEKLLDEGQGKFDQIMAGELSFAAKMEQFIKMKTDYGSKISKEFYIDFMNYSPEVRDFIMARSQRSMQILIGAFQNAQENGEIRADMDLKFLTFMLNKLMDIGEDPQLLALFSDTGELTRQWINFFMYGIIGDNPK
ncbi:MAG: TetR/AcrR family transcriptional regulator [Candidatus Neomarinimicrobiota bacterium]